MRKTILTLFRKLWGPQTASWRGVGPRLAPEGAAFLPAPRVGGGAVLPGPGKRGRPRAGGGRV